MSVLGGQNDKKIYSLSLWIRPPDNSAYLKINFVILNQNICCGPQKSRLHETVLLSTQNTCLD